VTSPVFGRGRMLPLAYRGITTLRVLRRMKPKQTNADLLQHLSRQQLAVRWQCSTETVRRREKAGILPSRRLGGLVRYRLADIEKIEQQAEVAL